MLGKIKSIDEDRLETDPTYRFEYLAEFIGFGPEDVAAIQCSAPFVGPLIPELVERTYARLLAYDATARHFLPRQHGFEGDPPLSAEHLDRHPQVQFRKDHLNRYFMNLIGRSYDAKMVVFLDMVGKMHTNKAGNPEIVVPLVQMNALMGLIADMFQDVILESPMEPSIKVQTLRAFQKLFWIQNDFIGRHYAESRAG